MQSLPFLGQTSPWIKSIGHIVTYHPLRGASHRSLAPNGTYLQSQNCIGSRISPADMLPLLSARSGRSSPFSGQCNSGSKTKHCLVHTFLVVGRALTLSTTQEDCRRQTGTRHLPGAAFLPCQLCPASRCNSRLVVCNFNVANVVATISCVFDCGLGLFGIAQQKRGAKVHCMLDTSQEKRSP